MESRSRWPCQPTSVGSDFNCCLLVFVILLNDSHFADTPGLAVENQTKPEETKIISGTGGLAKPEVVGKQILTDSLSGNFISITGIESWLITLLCSGMAPWGDLLFNLAQSLTVGPLKLVAFGLQWHYRKMIREKAASKQSAQ